MNVLTPTKMNEGGTHPSSVRSLVWASRYTIPRPTSILLMRGPSNVKEEHTTIAIAITITITITITKLSKWIK